MLLAKPAFAGDQLTVTSGGGSFQQAQRKAVFEPFSKSTGIKVTDDEYSYDSTKIRAMVQSKTVSWDVVNAGPATTIRLCGDGIIETIDWKKLGLDRAKFMDNDKNDCGVPNLISATVIAYDKDKLPSGPKTIADLFDLQKFPGKRGLTKGPWGNLEWALIADGVAIKDVYKVLSTREGVDRAFKKLDTIKKEVVWWTTGAQPPQLLADGQVVMTSAYNGRIYDAIKNSGKHFEIMWDAQQPAISFWVVPKGGPRLDDAYKFIAFASSPQAHAEMARITAYAPSNKDAMALVDPAILPHVPTAPDNLRNALPSDSIFWMEKGDELGQRFTAWLLK
ncbi:ABC transporter substrate-binding protein [Bradyrhizobium australiense]|uniref:ABC transporter substrate-binding protein n=1 Tax=Bradyrhizobium australiense TaxID=2721161 RepID=UPI00289D4499|nr:ABC transporter substrate-binding protein [Bradyrhizobium australiense]